jgi:hypothetical protein
MLNTCSNSHPEEHPNTTTEVPGNAHHTQLQRPLCVLQKPHLYSLSPPSSPPPHLHHLEDGLVLGLDSLQEPGLRELEGDGGGGQLVVGAGLGLLQGWVR